MSATGEHNLARLAEASFERRGDYPALLFEGRWYRSGELFERSQRIASGLVQLGVAPGDRVIVTMANSPEVGAVYQALWRAGAVITPAMFLLSEEELRHVMVDSEATAVVTTTEFAGKVTAAAAGLPHLKLLISAGDAGEDFVALESLEQAEPALIVPRSDDDLAALMYTGGTTGRAKGVMLTHSNLYYSGKAAHESAYVPGINRGLTSLPLSHSYGVLVTLVGLHSPERGIAVLLRWFVPTAFLELIAEHGIQVSAVVPSMLQMLLSQPLEDYNLSTLRYVSCGAAPLAREVAEEFCRRVPSVTIRQGYGLTETAALVAASPADRQKPGSVGQPVPGTEVRIVDDADRELEAGEPGEIIVRSPGVMRGYRHSAEASSQALRDGWLHTGDIGYLDQDGFLFIVDRKKDLIIRGGFNVYPRDVEDVLLEHPAVEVAAVVGRPDQVHGEEIVAYVSLRPDASVEPEQLVAWAREHIGAYKYPREVHVIDAVPLTAVGKIDRKVLRARARSEPEAPISSTTS